MPIGRSVRDGMYAQIGTDAWVYELVFLKNGQYDKHFNMPLAWQPVGSVLVYDPWN